VLRETGTLSFGTDNDPDPTPDAATDGGQEIET
jgi:hypothetical protein